MDGAVARNAILGEAAARPAPSGPAPALGGSGSGWWGRLIRTLGSKDSLAIIDQFVVSITRFLTSIIVGRACGPYELGDYTLGFTLYCIGACILTGLISLPFTVYGNHLHGEDRRAYSGSVLIHFAAFELSVMAILGLTTGVLALGYGWPGLVPLMGMLAVTFPVAFVVEFARRFALARLELTTAVAIDLAMSAIQIAGLLLLASMGRLSAEAAFAAMGLGGAVAGVTWLVLARRHFVIQRSRIFTDALRNWRFARWSLASQLVLVVRNTAVLWLLALLLGPTSTGMFVACDTLARLSAPFQMAVTNVLFPRAARAFVTGDMAEVRRLARQAAGVLCSATGLLFVLFISLGEVLLAELYGPVYGPQGTVLSLLALAMVADALETAATHVLMAMDRSYVVFVANLTGTVLTLTIAALLAPTWGIVGAAWGSLVGRCVIAVVMWATFLWVTRRESGGE